MISGGSHHDYLKNCFGVDRNYGKSEGLWSVLNYLGTPYSAMYFRRNSITGHCSWSYLDWQNIRGFICAHWDIVSTDGTFHRSTVSIIYLFFTLCVFLAADSSLSIFFGPKYMYCMNFPCGLARGWRRCSFAGRKQIGFVRLPSRYKRPMWHVVSQDKGCSNWQVGAYLLSFSKQWN